MNKFLDETGLSYFWEKIKNYVNGKGAVRKHIILYSSNWSNNSYTVSVPGILADETAQLIQPVPYLSDQANYIEAGILCTNQATNSLTFTCQTVPSTNINVHIVVQDVTTS